MRARGEAPQQGRKLLRKKYLSTSKEHRGGNEAAAREAVVSLARDLGWSDVMNVGDFTLMLNIGLPTGTISLSHSGSHISSP